MRCKVDIPAHFSPAELAERLDLHEETILRACRAGRIPEAARICGRWRIPAPAAAAWLERCRPHRPPAAKS